MSDGSITAAEARRRTILRTDWVPCKSAFIDCKTPGSEQKDNYSFIGVGVSQNPDQHINLAEKHGFNLGAAGMPRGVTNNLHLHFTSETFINFDGDFRVRWGVDGNEGEYLSRDGDVIVVPRWIFRGFTNEGPDDGILLTVLGRDDNGGIIWAPSVLDAAAAQGLYLSRDNRLIDTERGDPQPNDGDTIEPMAAHQIALLHRYTAADMRRRVCTLTDRKFSGRALLCTAAPGGAVELALVVGYGMSEDRRQVPHVTEPQSFNLAWVRARMGQAMLRHRHPATQTVTGRTGRWSVTLGTGADAQTVELGHLDTLSVPAGVWREFRCVDAGEDGYAELLVVNGADARVQIEWAPDVEAAAREGGWILDPDGYLAPTAVMRHVRYGEVAYADTP